MIVEASTSNTQAPTLPLPLVFVILRTSVVPSQEVTVPLIQFVLMNFSRAVTISPAANPLMVDPDRTTNDFEPDPIVNLVLLDPSTRPPPAPSILTPFP